MKGTENASPMCPISPRTDRENRIYLNRARSGSTRKSRSKNVHIALIGQINQMWRNLIATLHQESSHIKGTEKCCLTSPQTDREKKTYLNRARVGNARKSLWNKVHILSVRSLWEMSYTSHSLIRSHTCKQGRSKCSQTHTISPRTDRENNSINKVWAQRSLSKKAYITLL